jgi:hypothetical protein
MSATPIKSRSPSEICDRMTSEKRLRDFSGIILNADLTVLKKIEILESRFLFFVDKDLFNIIEDFIKFSPALIALRYFCVPTIYKIHTKS